MEDITDRCDIIFHAPPPPTTSSTDTDDHETGVVTIPMPIHSGSLTGILQLEEAEEVSLAQINEPLPQPSTSKPMKVDLAGEVEEDDDEEESASQSQYRNKKAEQSDSGSSEDSEDSGDDDEEEWEETLVYVDLDEIPSVEELFAVEPDEFLNCQTKRMREQKKPRKDTHPELELRFYNLDGANPVLQIGQRFFLGKFEDTFGTHLFFRDKSSSETGTPSPLTKLTKDIDPPPDPVFSKKPPKEYELVANVQKVLKMTRQNIVTDIEKLKIINSQFTDDSSSATTFGTSTGRPITMARTTTLKEVLAHKYVPKRKPDMNITKKDIKYNSVPGRSKSTTTKTTEEEQEVNVEQEQQE